jgi:hypothetical protein
MTHLEYENIQVPIIIQAVGGDLRLRGRDESWLVVDGDNATVEQLGEGQPYVVRCSSDARITVPDNVDVSVQNVGNDAKITDVGGKTDVQNIGGDLMVRSTGDIRVKTVGSDLRVKRVEGNVTIETVGSDATIREVNGSVWIANIGSDLYMRNIEGSCKIESVGSDLVLSLDFVAGQEYHFSVGGDILCRVQPDADARLILPLETEVRLDVPAEIEENTDAEEQIVTLGDGSATVYIKNADALRLVGEGEDYMINFGIQIEEELEARLSSLEEKLSTQLDGLDERIQAKTAQFASQAEKFAERAQKQAERAAERIRRSMERQSRKRKPGPRRVVMSMQQDAAKRKNDDPVSEQERLMILKMVQDNTISIEEAERLLAALDK